MNVKLPQSDPIGAYQRKAIAARRIGPQQCACGEARPEALCAGRDPVICAECERATRGITTMDDHHLFRQVNSPLTVPVPVNDHAADLTVAQNNWPKETRDNPDGSPLLAAAACIRGFVDWVFYVIQKGMLWIPEMLEALNRFLVDKFGPQWWIGTPLAQFAPKKA